MKKVIIKLRENKYGTFVKSFTKLTMCVTDDINLAGKYSVKIAQHHIDNKKLNAELVPAITL